MLEKYFIWGGLAVFLLITAGILGETIVYWRFRHIKKLIQLNMLRRRQIFGETHFFSAAVLDMAASRLFFSLSTTAHQALTSLTAGRAGKAAAYFEKKHPQFALLLKAHNENTAKIYNKLTARRKLLKNPLIILSAAQMAHILFKTKDLQQLLNKIKSQHLPKPLKAVHCYLSAAAYLQEGDMLSASEKASLALKLFKQKHYIFETAQTYLLLAEIYRISCVNDVAQTMIEAALKMYSAAGFRLFCAQTTAVFGMLMLFENRLEEAEDKFSEALKSCPQDILKADILNQYALLQLAQKNKGSALKYAKQALKIHCSLGNFRGEAFSRQLLGHFLLSSGAAQKAASEAKKAAELYLEQQNFSAYCESLYLHARSLCQTENYGRAEKILRQILEESRRHSLNFHIANAYSLLGLIYMQKQDLSRAKALLQQSLHLEQNHNRCTGLAADYANLALIENLSGDKDAAGQNLQIALEYAQKTGDDELLELIKNKLKN